MNDAQEPDAPSRPGAADLPGNARKPPAVLVVDDELSLLRTVTRVLARSGYQVLQASSGEEALRVAAAHAGPVDLLLTDVSMPGIGGRELSAKFSSAHPSVPIVFMSGQTDDVTLLHEIRVNNVDFLRKPFGVEEILSKVQEALGRLPR